MFKDRLLQKLAEQGDKISHTALAKKVGIKQSYFSRIITGGIKNPGVYTVRKIAQELNCSTDELIGRKIKGSASKPKSHKLEFHSELAFEAINLVLTLLDQSKQSVELDEFFNIAQEVYQYSLDKNSNTVDKVFADWFVKYFIASKASKQ